MTIVSETSAGVRAFGNPVQMRAGHEPLNMSKAGGLSFAGFSACLREGTDFRGKTGTERSDRKEAGLREEASDNLCAFFIFRGKESLLKSAAESRRKPRSMAQYPVIRRFTHGDICLFVRKEIKNRYNAGRHF